jgi:steroid Delta-isomerase
MFEEEKHPARRASLLSREYVKTHNKEGWLGLYAEDAIIEDPIGKSYIDPEGNGHRGVAAREAFYDNFIAPADINLEIVNSYAAGLECANNVVITIQLPGENGKTIQQMVHGIFTYHVNEEGKLTAMRGYWDTEDPINAMTEIEAA